jgi:hypothetical protein
MHLPIISDVVNLSLSLDKDEQLKLNLLHRTVDAPDEVARTSNDRTTAWRR